MSNSTVASRAGPCLAIEAAIPQDWTTTKSSDTFYNVTGCAIPVCENNEAILQKCGNTTTQDLRPFYGSNDKTYIAYALPKNTDAQTYQAFQDCLLDNNAIHYQCTTHVGTQSGCNAKSLTTEYSVHPADAQTDYQVCTMPNSANSTEIMSSCCDDVQSDAGGCQVSCYTRGNGTTLSQCISNNPLRQSLSLGYVCGRSVRNTGNSVRFASPKNMITMITVVLPLMALVF